jgi:hypothetical protein
MSEDVQKKAKDGKDVEFNPLFANFLQNVLFWKKSDNPARNQIFLDEKSGKLTIGTKQYDLIDIAEQEKEIVSDSLILYN